MTVKELIERLREMPQDLPVGYVYDGSILGSADSVYVTAGESWKLGGVAVVICDDCERAFSYEERPAQ